jgi:predicted alpha/beta superfamily hydrolase
MRLSGLSFLLVIGVMAFSANTVEAQPSRPFGSGHPAILNFANSASSQDFKSKINGRTYRLFVAVPRAPAPKDGFPVIYILDGNIFFGIASDGQGIRQMRNELASAIVVGIGYPSYDGVKQLSTRKKDLTTPISPARLRPDEKDYVDNNGGMDDFLHVIEREIKPRIAKLAPINASNQALFGHSLGGLTVLHALFTEPSAFQTYIASSPSIWWNDKSVLADEATFSKEVTASHLQPRILIDVGGLEPDSDTGGRMISNAVDLGKRLKELKGGPAYAVQTVVFPDETHSSVMPAAISRALTFAFGPKQ